MKTDQLQEVACDSSLFDTLPAGVVVMGDSGILHVNKPMMDIARFNGSLDTFLRYPLRKWIHSADLPMVLDYHGKRLQGEDAPESYDFRLLRFDGSDGWVNCRSTVTVWDGKPATISTLSDVTDKKVVEGACQRSEQLFRTVFNVTPEIMATADITTRALLDVNPTFLNVFGFRRDQVIGKALVDLDLWADPLFDRRFNEELKLNTSMSDIPAAIRVRGNVIRHFRLFVHKMEMIEQPQLLLIARDVTDDMIRSQELQRNRDIAELANRAKSEFLANMSHELRTPLNAILGFAEILKDEIIGPIENQRYREYASDIHRSGSHLLSIINDILDLSKVEAGRLETAIRWFNPAEPIRMAAKLVAQNCREAELSLSVDIDKTVEIEADERLVKQIALNLLSNAVKFTEAGGEVSVEFSRSSGDNAVLTIEDTGIGMTTEEITIARLPFGQIDNALSRRQEGSGLGLSLVAAFAEKMGANFVLDSALGKGTRASVIFPAERVRLSESNQSA